MIWYLKAHVRSGKSVVVSCDHVLDEKECRHSVVCRVVQCFVKGSVVSFVKQQYANPVKQTKRLSNAIPGPYSQLCIDAKCPEAKHSCRMFLQYAAFSWWWLRCLHTCSSRNSRSGTMHRPGLPKHPRKCRAPRPSQSLCKRCQSIARLLISTLAIHASPSSGKSQTGLVTHVHSWWPWRQRLHLEVQSKRSRWE